MRRRGVTAALGTAAAALAIAAPAQAGWLRADTVDGPNANIVGLAGAELGHDGTGAVGYLKRDGGVPHVFAAQLRRGRPQAPTRVDVGQAGPSSDARLAAGDANRAVAVWINGGALWASLKAGAKQPWTPPARVYTGPATDPVLDMSIFGTAYVSFTTGADVRVARMPWYTGRWTVLPRPLDIDPARVAGDADLAASADGSAIVAWKETGADGRSHVWVRRVTDDGLLSGAPREASLGSLSRRPGGNADSPSVTIQDDSSYAFVSLRQDFNDAGTNVSRSFARRLVASRLEAPRTTDGLRFPNADGAATPQVSVSGGGEGLAVVGLRSGRVSGRVIGVRGEVGARWRRIQRIGAGGAGTAPPLTATMADRRIGAVAWQQGPTGIAPSNASLVARAWNGERFEGPVALTPPSFGPAAAQYGIDSGSDSNSDLVVGFVQGSLGSFRIAVAAYSGTLHALAILRARERWKRNRRPKMRWRAATHVLWGPIRYRVDIDGIPRKTTRRTSWRPAKPLPDGAHVVEIVQLDGRGTESPGLKRPVWIDTTRPLVKLRRVRGGYRVSALDGTAIQGSGIESLRVQFSRGSARVRVPRIGVVRNAYVRGRGRVRRIVAADKVGNRSVVSAHAASRPGGAR